MKLMMHHIMNDLYKLSMKINIHMHTNVATFAKGLESDLDLKKSQLQPYLYM